MIVSSQHCACSSIKPWKQASAYTMWWANLLNKANLRDLIAETGLVILLKFYPNRRFFSPCDLEIWWMTSKNNRAPLLYYINLCIISNPSVNSKWSYSPETLNLGQNWQFLSRVTLKFDEWPWKTIRHLFCAISSYMHHFVAIGEFKLELQSENAQFGSKSVIFCPVWPWNLTDDL